MHSWNGDPFLMLHVKSEMVHCKTESLDHVKAGPPGAEKHHLFNLFAIRLNQSHLSFMDLYSFLLILRIKITKTLFLGLGDMA